ncbi:MAG TPA: S8 family serine peptidase [Chitinispirillaceae bacterium]|nr:S8 family serine peptidase [Chitinispirillaceae bacterium]
MTKLKKKTNIRIEKSFRTEEICDLLVFLDDNFEKSTLSEIKKLSLEMSEYPEGYNCYRISIQPQNTKVLASLPDVAEIVEWQEKQFTMSDARELTKVNALQGSSITKVHPPTKNWLNGVPHTGDSTILQAVLTTMWGYSLQGIMEQVLNMVYKKDITLCSIIIKIVGASEKKAPIIANFSSMGPTRDGRIGPDVVAPGAGVYNLIYEYEIDSIALKNNGIRTSWTFGTSDPTWGVTSDKYLIWDLEHSYGTLKFKSAPGGYMWSDDIFPTDTVVCNVNDTLVLRIKALETVYGIPENMKCALLLKRPVDGYHRRGIYVSFMITADGNWHDVIVPLLDSTLTYQDSLSWADEPDTIQRLRLDFGRTHSGIVSSFPYNGQSQYNSWTGTSMSSPHVSGVVALMLQKFRETVLIPRNIANGTSLNIHDNPFWNSTARAIIAHTATDMSDTVETSSMPFSPNPDFEANGYSSKTIYAEGPDWVTGYGLVNALKAVNYVDTNRFIEDTIDQSVTEIKKIHMTSSTDTLRVTLCWDDPANALTGESDAYRCKLVNDLDLYLRHPASGTVVYPWVLNHSGMHANTLPANGIDSITPSMILSKKAFRGIDTLNNLEVVDVVSPDTGIWEVYVVPRYISADQSSAAGINQEYSLVSDIPFLPSPVADTVALVMGFEKATLWSFITGSGTLSNLASPKTQGSASMQISGNGYQQIRSINLKTNQLAEKNKILCDIYVGTTQPNPYWIGYAQLLVHCPSANIYNMYIGQVMLNGLPLGTFSTLTYTLPSTVLTALAGSHNDFSFSLVLNTNTGSGPYYFDNMRFSN